MGIKIYMLKEDDELDWQDWTEFSTASSYPDEQLLQELFIEQEEQLLMHG